MLLSTVLVTTITGVLGGLCHSFLFLYQKKQLARFVHVEHCTERTRKIMIASSIWTILRMALFGLFVIFLLLSPSIHPILLMASFLFTFWLVILNNKATFYEQL